jgi:hypothetical protein
VNASKQAGHAARNVNARTATTVIRAAVIIQLFRVMKFLKDLIMHLRIRKIQKNLPQTSENAIKSKKIDKNPLTVQGKISHC